VGERTISVHRETKPIFLKRGSRAYIHVLFHFIRSFMKRAKMGSLFVCTIFKHAFMQLIQSTAYTKHSVYKAEFPDTSKKKKHTDRPISTNTSSLNKNNPIH